MKRRAEIKAQAMSGFIKKYWPVVGIGLLGMLIVAVMGHVPAVGVLLNLLVGTIIIVGLRGFYLAVYRGDEIKVESLVTPFNRYGRVLGGSLWMYLWLFLWALIFIVPLIVFIIIGFVSAMVSGGSIAALVSSYAHTGMMVGGTHSVLPVLPTISSSYANMGMMGNGWAGMPWNNLPFWNNLAGNFNPLWLLILLLLIPLIIKAYSYFCTQYILADSPNVPAMDALSLSKKMMAGYKWKLFVAQLTFIGWFILCGLTAGILWIFYVGPYFNAAMAGFYEEIKEQAKQKGIAGTEALE